MIQLVTHNRFSNVNCVHAIIQVVYTEVIKVVLTEYSAFKSSSKIIQDHAAAVVIIALIAEKNNSRKKRPKKNESRWKLGLKGEKLELYEALLAELGLQDEYNYNILFTNDF